MREIATAWVAKAEVDFGNAGTVLKHGEEHVVESVCFHSQQCVEKYLKAFLEEHEIEFRRIHSLDPLLNLCAGKDGKFIEFSDDVSRLESYAVTIRYPGATASRREAEVAFTTATQIRRFVRGALGLPD